MLTRELNQFPRQQFQQQKNCLPFSFSNSLNAVTFSFSWGSNRRIKFQFFSDDLLLFHFDLFSPLNDVNLNFLVPDFLPDFRCLELVCQLGFRFLKNVTFNRNS